VIKEIYKKLFDELEKGHKGIIKTILIDNVKNLKKEIILEDEISDNIFKPTIVDDCLYEPYFPKPKLVIFGGGHIAKPLSEFASRVGFSLTVVDDRPSFANSARFPDAEEIICESFEKSFDLINFNQSTFVVIITRGHRHDIACLRNVLNKQTAYIGMIGSKRRIRNTKEQLLTEGFTKEAINKLKAPIGLDIGAVTPDEIAFSIIAQLIEERRVGTDKKNNWPEFDMEVLKELSNCDDTPKALVTIIGTKGSVPRKAGAKMLVFDNGQVLGSIGGGCSEAEVLINARRILKKGGYMIQRVDMTGDIAEEEGMACGGIMEVLIEPLINS